MSGSQRRHRSATKNYDDLATPRASNHSSDFQDSYSHPSANHNGTRPSQETNVVRQRSHSSSRYSHDATKMQHYQYQENPNLKKNQQYMQKQGQLQHHHRNYSEERQTTSECSRSSNFTSQRDDSIAHWCTPPRSNASRLDRVNEPLHYPRDAMQYPGGLSIHQYYDSGNNLRDDVRQPKMKRSQSSGVAEMSRINAHSDAQNNDPSNRYSKDDSYGVMNHSDQNRKGKSSNKGLLSRASHKIRKRLVGSSSSSNASESKEINVEKQYSGDNSRLSVDISTVQYVREGRDPSPTGGSVEQRQKFCINHPNDGDIDVGTGPFYDDQGNLVQDFLSVDFSDMSTLESNFTYPIGDVVIGSTWMKERKLPSLSSDVVLGTPPRFPRTRGASSVPSRTSPNLVRSLDSTQLSKSHQKQSYPVAEYQLIYDGKRSSPETHANGQNKGNIKVDENSGAADDLLLKQNTDLTSEVENVKLQQASDNTGSIFTESSISHLEAKILKLEAELLKKEGEIDRAIKQNSSIVKELEESNKTTLHLTTDLDSYKNECASHRERVLQSEREIAKMEQVVYNERRKVLSLEAENQMLLNLADERIGHATNSEKAKETEMIAYKDQCKRYREQVIQLERKLITAESALEATGNMATALEGDKKAIAVELDQRITETKSLKAQLDEKEAKLLSTQTELHNLQSKWSHLDNSGSKTDDREQTISVLESENYNLVRKLEAQSISLERFQREQEKHSRLELEYNALKKRHDELHTNDAELRRQLMDAQDAASNSERLQKNVADSESFISSLQSDLAQTRASHHQQLLEIRNRHVTEIDHLSDELQKEKHAKREAENVNSELLDKILNLETTVDRLEQKMTSQSKCHADQTDKLMQELNETREKLSVTREEASIAKQECIDKTRAIDRLQSDIEHQKNQFSSTISRLEKDLDAKAKEVQQLQIVVEERDRDVVNLKSDVSLRDHRTANDIDRLNEVIHQLQQDLKSSAAEKEFLRTSKDALQTQIQTTKLQVEESIASLRREKATLASDVQTHLVDAKTEIIQYVNGVVMGQWRRMENYQLHQSMNHEVALASAREELNKMDHLLQEGRNKAQQLQKSLRLLRDENDEALRSIKTISSKLSVPEKDVVEKIEDLLIELSDARSEIATIGIDLTTTMSELAKLNHEKDQLTLDRDHMKNVLDLTTAQMKEFETDANVQREKASSAITCLEQKLANDRCSFENKMAANEQIVAGLRAENERLQCSFNEAKKECATMRDELSVTKKDVVSLNEQLREKTETIHNLNDLLSRASQKAADDLVNHYMKIEDDLRAQLYTVQCEKEAIERQMKTQVEESGRTLEEFQVSKEELLACVDRLSSDLNIAQQQVQTMESELRYLSEEKGELFVEYTKAIRERDLISVKNSSSSKQIQNLTCAIEKLNNVHVSSEREHTAEVSRLADELIQTHSVEIDELNNKLLEANLIINELKSTLKDVKTEHTCDLNMSIEFYKSELDSQKANHLKYIEGKKEEMARLRNEVDELTSSKSLLEGKLSEREDLIDQLKASLRDALQNALQSDASKRDSDDKLAEISDTLSSYDQIEECASSLSGSLSGILHLKSTIERLISDKQDLECTLTESQTALASLQSKLSVVNQVNEQLREEIKAQKDKVNQLNDENKERLVDQKWMEDRLESLQNERQKETEICHDLVARMQKELEIAKQNEEELMGQIMVLRQDCDIEYLYKELLDKMKEKELKYESEIQNLVVQNDTLKNSLATLSEEKKSLLRAYDESNANTSGLVQRLDDANAHSSKLVEKLASAENELKVLRRNVMSKDIQNDEMSTASSLASNMLNQTASDLDSTIKSIKKHHLSTVQKLRNELDEMRTRWKKSEQRVKELTKLLQDNSKVIDALHKKLTGKQRHIKGNKTTMISSSSSSAQQSFSAE